MKAVIPCALKEDSLFPMIESKPTAMMPVMGKPVVKHLIRDLQELGVDDVYLVTSYMEDSIREEFEEYTNVNIVSQEDLNGTGGAVEKCSFIDEDFIVVNGDVVVSKADLESLLEKHRENEPSVTVLADMESKPEKFGVLSIENDRIVDITEKPEDAENPLINTGIYVFKPDIFKYLSNMDGKKDLTEAVQKSVEDNEGRFELIEHYWIDIGSPKRLWEADQVKREYELEHQVHETAKIAENAEILGEAEIQKGAEIKPGTVIEGKVFVGKESVIGPNTTVRDSSITGGTQIRSADIESSVLFEGNIVDPSVHIEHAVIAEQCTVKSNTTVQESFIGPRSFIEMNNSVYGVKFVPDARTDLGEISK